MDTTTVNNATETALVQPNGTITKTPMKFTTMTDFKKRVGIESGEIVRNPNTGKLFLETDKGKFRVENVQEIDPTKVKRWMYESEETFNQGCVIYIVEPKNNVVDSI